MEQFPLEAVLCLLWGVTDEQHRCGRVLQVTERSDITVVRHLELIHSNIVNFHIQSNASTQTLMILKNEVIKRILMIKLL